MGTFDLQPVSQNQGNNLGLELASEVCWGGGQFGHTDLLPVEADVIFA